MSQNVHIETFVMVHDQGLVLECEREGRFAGLPSYRYLFLGAGDVSRLEGARNVIVARELEDNIEQHPEMLAFTGWYAVARNRLAEAERVTLLEYDVQVSAGFVDATLACFERGKRLVGYVGFPLSHPMYLFATPCLLPALRQAHGLDAWELVQDHLASGGSDVWPATTNASLSSSDLADFVEWFLPVSRLLRDEPMAAHVHERALPLYCMVCGLEYVVVEGALHHDQKRSHGILARSWDEAGAEAERESRRRGRPPSPGRR
jgi:hypothetical protein